MSNENYIGISGVAEYVDAAVAADIKNTVWGYLNNGNHLVLKFERNGVSHVAIEAALEHEAASEGRVHVIIPATIGAYRQHLELDNDPITEDESEYLLRLLEKVEQSHPWTLVEVKSMMITTSSYNQMNGMFVDLARGGVQSFFVNRERKPVDDATLLALRRGTLISASDYTVPSIKI